MLLMDQNRKYLRLELLGNVQGKKSTRGVGGSKGVTRVNPP